MNYTTCSGMLSVVMSVITAPKPTEKKPIPYRLSLRTVKASRQTFARLMRGYADGTIDRDDFKTLIYAFSHYLQFLRLEKDLNIEERMEALEAQLENRNA